MTATLLQSHQQHNGRRTPEFMKARSKIPPTVFGICDPFDSQFIPITAVTSQLLVFMQHYHAQCWSPKYLPRLPASQGDSPAMDNVQSEVVSSGQELWSLYVANQCTFWAMTSGVIHGLRPLLSDQRRAELDEAGLQIKSLVLAQLIRLFAKDPNLQPTMNLIYRVKGLFHQSATSGDLKAAHIHARSLTWLAGQVELKEELRNLARTAHYLDVGPAFQQLRRPLIDYGHWRPGLVSQIWDLGEVQLPNRQEVVSEDLPSNAHSEVLRDAFLYTRYALRISDRSLEILNYWANQKAALRRRELLFKWIGNMAVYHMNRLLNLYADLTQLRQKYNLIFTESERCTEAALTLALLHVFQKSFHEVIIDGGVDVDESAFAIYHPLKDMIQRARQNRSEDEETAYQDVQLWLLYVGTLCETRLRFTPASTSFGIDIAQPCDDWFHRELAKEALTRKVVAWDEAKAVLGRFVINPRLDPNGSIWASAMSNAGKDAEEAGLTDTCHR